MVLLFFLILVILLVLNVPVAISIGGASLALLLMKELPIVLIAQQMYEGCDSFTLLAIPFFLLAGNLMDFAGISLRVVNFVNSFFGFVRGGLAMVSVGACMFFAGISGSATADSAAIGSIVIPSMIKKGYDRDFSAALVAAAGVMGPIIPPSITFVIYGVISNTSIAELFLAGAIPGVMIGLSLMIISYIFAIKRNYPKETGVPFQQKVFHTKRATLAIIMPLIILGGILGGIFTPTEASVVAVIYAFVVGKWVYKELKFGDLKEILLRSADSTAQVMWVLAAATVATWLIISENIPFVITNFLLSLTTNKFLLLALINVVLFIAGTFLDPPPAMIMLVPVLLPIAQKLGIDPVHFGVIVNVNLVIGLITPPSAPCLMVTAAISGGSFGRISVVVLPFLAVELLVLIIVTYFPQIYMWLPLWYRAAVRG